MLKPTFDEPKDLKSELQSERFYERFLSIFLALVLAVAFSYIIFNYSREHGRCASIPFYDDCTYILSGAVRYKILMSDGPLALIRFQAQNFSHSPWSEFLALFSYVVFGLKEHAPYAGNAVLVVAFLLMVNNLMAGRRIWEKVPTFVFALSIPYTTYCIYEFRPDLACSLFTAFGVIATVRSSWIDSSRWHRASLGAIFGAAMLTKPSVFLLTGMFFVLSMIFSLAIDFMLKSPRTSLKSILSSTVPAIVTFILVCLPHYFFAIRYVFYYFWLGMVYERKIWDLNASAMVHARFYLDDMHSGGIMLGKHLYSLFGLIVCGWVVSVWKGSRADRLRTIAFSILLLISYLVPTCNGVKSMFLGAIFHAMLIMYALWSVAFLGGIFSHALTQVNMAETLDRIRSANRKRSVAVGVCFLALAIVGCLSIIAPVNYGDRTNPIVIARNRSRDTVYDIAVDYMKRNPGDNLKIFMAFHGNLNLSNISFNFVRAGLKTPSFANLDKYYRPDEIQGNIQWADFIVAPEPGHTDTNLNLPVGEHEDDILRLLRSTPGLNETHSIPFTDKFAYYIFEKDRRFEFFGYEAGLGIVDKRGAIVGQPTGWAVVGSSPSSTFRPKGEPAPRYRIDLEGAATMKNLTVTLQAGNTVVAKHTFVQPRVIESFNAEFELPEKGDITINYSSETPVPPKTEMVYFNKFKLYTYAFNGWRAQSGLADLEGPYPQWNLGAVRWGLHPSTHLIADRPEGGTYILECVAKAETVLTMTIEVAGKKVLEHTFNEPSKFENLSAEFELPPGGEITLNYSHGAPIKEKPMSVLFKALRLQKK